MSAPRTAGWDSKFADRCWRTFVRLRGGNLSSVECAAEETACLPSRRRRERGSYPERRGEKVLPTSSSRASVEAQPRASPSRGRYQRADHIGRTKRPLTHPCRRDVVSQVSLGQCRTLPARRRHELVMHQGRGTRHVTAFARGTFALDPKPRLRKP